MSKILIIDDESDICLLLSTMLKKAGNDVDFALNIASGIQKLQHFNPDIIFLDLNLPDGNGFDVVPDIRDQQPHAEIIVISAYDGEDEKKRADDENIEYFINKPLQFDKVKKVVHELQSA